MPPDRLILIRHAKSSWDDPDLPDHDRTLNDRGRASCAAIGRWLADRGEAPGMILCSTAQRAVETARGIVGHLPDAPEPRLCPELYLAGPDQIRETLAKAEPGTVLMVGHNPGFAEFAEALVQGPAPHPKFTQYPTCACLIVDLPKSVWRSGVPTAASFVAFTVPRDLME